MKYVLISDVHLSERPPSSCTDSYLEDLFDLLEQVWMLAGAHQAAAIVIAGDLFHHKTGIRTSHRLVQRVIAWFNQAPCPVYVVAGNHDITHDRLESLSAQPLGVLYASGAALKLEGWGSLPGLYGVPWQQHWDDEHVGAALADYRAAGHDGLVVAHAPLYPPGLELPYEFYPAGKFAEAMDLAGGHVFYGHVHEPHGVYRVGGVTFCNNGALSRGSLHEYNLNRQPCCTIWNSELGTFTAVGLQAKPASQVFRLQEKQRVTDLAGRLDSFLEQIGSSTLELVTTESVIEHLRGMDLDRPVLALAEELLRDQR